MIRYGVETDSTRFGSVFSKISFAFTLIGESVFVFVFVLVGESLIQLFVLFNIASHVTFGLPIHRHANINVTRSDMCFPSFCVISLSDFDGVNVGCRRRDYYFRD